MHRPGLTNRRFLQRLSILFFLAAALPRQGLTITNEERPGKGWWGFSIPSQYALPPRSYDPRQQQLPMNASACQQFRHPRVNCPKYEEVDLLLNLMGSSSWDERALHWLFIDTVQHEHPWRNALARREIGNEYFPDNVQVETVNEWAELARITQSLLDSCHVIRNLIVGSHGNLGRLMIGNHPHEGQTSLDVNGFFGISGLLCAATPDSKIQFTACRMACFNGYRPDEAHPACSDEMGTNYAKKIQTELAVVGSRYLLEDGKCALNGIQLLFNSGDGISSAAIRNFALHLHDNVGLSGSNDQAVVYSIYEDEVRADTPMDEVKACPND